MHELYFFPFHQLAFGFVGAALVAAGFFGDVVEFVERDGAAGGSLDVTVKVTSADMAIPDVNKEIRNKDWFDYAGFPQAEFHSNDLRRMEGNRYVARGTLSLKGAKQPVEVPFTWTASGGGAAMEGELTLKRGDFGIGLGEWKATDTIGAEVKVKFKVKLRKG